MCDKESKMINPIDKINDLKIQTKLVLGLTVIFVLFIVFGLTIFSYIGEVSRCNNLTEYSLKAVNYMRAARIYENEYFNGYKTVNLDNNQKNISLLLVSLKKLAEIEKNKEFIANIDILVKLVKEYNQGLKSVSGLITERGKTENDGISGRITVRTINIENILKDQSSSLQSGFLKVSKLQKEYEQSKNPEIIMLFGNELLAFKEKINSNSALDNILEDYRSLFYQIVAIDNQIKGNKEEFSQYISKIEPGINKYDDYLDKFVNMLKLKAIIFISILSIIIFLVIIFVCIIVTRSITSPIKKIAKSTGVVKGLTNYLSKIINSNVIETKKMTGLMEKNTNFIDDQAKLINGTSISLHEFNENLNMLTSSHSGERKNVEKQMNLVLEAKNKNNKLLSILNETKDFSKATIEASSAISDITYQLRHLVHNSGIEAQNGGESSKFFKNLLTELNKLSVKSQESSVKIKDLAGKNIKQFETSIESSMKIIDDLNHFIDNVESNTNNSVTIFNNTRKVSASTSKFIIQFANLVKKNDESAALKDELEFMVKNVDKSIKNLLDAKSKSNNLINNILEEIKTIAGEDEEIDNHFNSIEEIGIKNHERKK